MSTPASLNLPVILATLAERLQARGHKLVTAESCTGGLIGGACTDLAGSSRWFERGFVTYSNHAKHELLGVSAELLATRGAVCEPVARAMAEGALAHAHPHAQVSLAVTGIAGPDGGSAHKPVGTVWFAWSVAGQTEAERVVFSGDRATVRQQTVAHALAGLLARLS